MQNRIKYVIQKMFIIVYNCETTKTWQPTYRNLTGIKQMFEAAKIFNSGGGIW